PQHRGEPPDRRHRLLVQLRDRHRRVPHPPRRALRARRRGGAGGPAATGAAARATRPGDVPAARAGGPVATGPVAAAGAVAAAPVAAAPVAVLAGAAARVGSALAVVTAPRPPRRRHTTGRSSPVSAAGRPGWRHGARVQETKEEPCAPVPSGGSPPTRPP